MLGVIAVTFAAAVAMIVLGERIPPRAYPWLVAAARS